MAEIEFLTPDVAEQAAAPEPASGPDAVDDRATGRTRVLAAVGGPVLLLGAAAVAVRATFGAVYELSSTGSSDIGTFHVDGWGRYHATRSSLTFTGHADRYGLVAVVAAGLLVLAALTAGGAALRPRPGRGTVVMAAVAHAGALLGAGALAAIGGVGWIRAGTERDALTAAVLRGDPGTLSITVDSGSFVWLSAAAAGLAAAGVVVPFVVRMWASRAGAVPPPASADDAHDAAPVESGTPEHGPLEFPGVDLDGDEELLGR